jgi:NADH-quinone oxidoreductase subunit C
MDDTNIPAQVEYPLQNQEASAQALVDRFGARREDFQDEIRLYLGSEHLLNACQVLRDEFGFEHFAGLTGVDYAAYMPLPKTEPRFHLVYFLHSYQHNARIQLRVPVSGMHPIVPSVENVYWNANWYEREVWDMFGVRFEGNSDLRRILMPYEWEGHPLRKDYPLGYEEVRFTFNEEELDRLKPSPKD